MTIGQTLAVAAHLDGAYSSNLDVTGLAQKYGAVLSHVKVALDPKHLHATRIASGEANTLIGADLVVSSGNDVLGALTTNAGGVVNSILVPTSEFSRNPDWSIDKQELIQRIAKISSNKLLQIDATQIATRYCGDGIFANLLMLGLAWQRGEIPLSL